MRKPCASVGVLAAAMTVVAALPAVGVEGSISIEEAWAVSSEGAPGHMSAYLVINNRTRSEVTIVGVSSPMAQDAHILMRSGAELLYPVIPINAELYMMPEGVRISLEGATGRPGQTIPLEVTLSEGPKAMVDATILPPGTSPPDHHNFVH